MSHIYHKDRHGFYRVRDEGGHLVCRDIAEERTARLHAKAPDLYELAKDVYSRAEHADGCPSIGCRCYRYAAAELIRAVEGG